MYTEYLNVRVLYGGINSVMIHEVPIANLTNSNKLHEAIKGMLR